MKAARQQAYIFFSWDPLGVMAIRCNIRGLNWKIYTPVGGQLSFCISDKMHQLHFKLEGAPESTYLPRELLGVHTSPFQKFFRGHIRIVPGNMQYKYEVRSFNGFGVNSI